MRSTGRVFLDAVKGERDQRFWSDLIGGAPEEREWRRQQAAQAELRRVFRQGRIAGPVEA